MDREADKPPRESIPAFPEFRDLQLADRPLLLSFYKTVQPEISELTFTSLFSYRVSDRTKISRIDNTILLKMYLETKNREIFFPPIGTFDIVSIIDAIDRTERRDQAFYGLSKDQAESLSKIGFTIEPDRDNWDYVYLVKDLAELKGPKYHSKRREVKQCLSEHNCEYRPITGDLVNRCLQLQEEWCNVMNCEENPSLKNENLAVRETFKNFAELNVFGGAAIVDGRLEAFTVGERLNTNTALVLFEKANPEIRGLYQVINQWFSQNALKDYQFSNRGQDIGDSGLRRAKQSYRPHHMVEKYAATRGQTNKG